MPGIRLIETGGHVPGHQSVLIHLAQTGPVLLAIDAIPRTTDLDAETREISAFDMDAASVRASTRKLTGIAERENVTLIICEHDREQWEHLKKAPECYM
ncbi:hypothetical protein KDAU_53470 [Dictyobacter aurantiacus]|uniref:Metallo-beta-lactamase domain-containing protein n=2 Tax=Dictyobacter aurantiacus TaxID=1936993 RepID=A0A401ZME6_9CHLR|nr:hypothetical protein KDAU_53470 [Dictyobacter aurantiacus]